MKQASGGGSMMRGRRSSGRGLWRWLPVAGPWLLLPPVRVQAHTTFPGLGEFASGFLHPLTTPVHLLVLLTLGLWLGQHAPLRLKWPTVVFASAALAGLLWTALRPGGVPPPVLITLGLGAGGCVAIGKDFSAWIKVGVCGLAGLLLGLDSGVEGATAVWPLAKILAATWVCLMLCLVNAAFYVSLLPTTRWVQTGVRVLGSWIVAIALLLLAFALRR